MASPNRGILVATLVLLSVCAALLAALLVVFLQTTSDQQAEALRLREGLLQSLTATNSQLDGVVKDISSVKRNVESIATIQAEGARRADAMRGIVGQYLSSAEERYQKAVYENKKVQNAMQQIIVQGEFTYAQLLFILRTLAEQ